MLDDMDLGFHRIAALSDAISERRLDPVALSEAMLLRIEALNPALNAYVAVCRDAALSEAAKAAERAATGQGHGVLDGIPVAVKDNIDVAGLPTSNGFGGSPWRLPTEDAEVVRRLRAAGAVILGKLNMHEAALGGTSDNPHFGAVINPYRAGHTPGGSSGGSGAAVAAGLCAAALGTDTGGSIRMPAAYCGVVGFKPSYGAISTRGIVPLSWSLDHVGPLTRNVADARLVFRALRGFDPACPEARPSPPVEPLPVAIESLRLGVVENLADDPIDRSVTEAFLAALGVFERLGCTIRYLALSDYDSLRARRAALLRMEADAAVAHAELYECEPERFSPAIRAYLDFAKRASAAQLARADRVIAEASLLLARIFDEVDAILSPTTPQPAFAFTDPTPANQNAFCLLANFAGAPAISLPMGLSPEGLPLGLQIVAAQGRDELVLQLGEVYEGAAGHGLHPPPPYGRRSNLR